MIDICHVGSRIKYHLLSKWSIVMTSLGEFRLVNFAPNSYESPLKWHNQSTDKGEEGTYLRRGVTLKECNEFLPF